MEQDKYGILWLGTSNGLIKYGGNAFLNMSWEPEHVSDIYHGPISSIVSDSRGLLWIVSRSGLNIYYPDKERFFKITSDSLTMLHRTVEDRDSTMWVLGNRHLYRVTTRLVDDMIVTDWSENLVSTSQNLNLLDLVNIDKGLYLLATTSGLYRMSFPDESEMPTFEREKAIPLTSVSCLLLQNNMIWIGTEDGLFKTVLDGSRIRLLNRYVHSNTDQNSIAHNHITALLVGNDDRLWVGTRLGGMSLHHEENETFTNYSADPKKKGVISGNMINCIYEDPFSVLWIGTAQAGLNKLNLTPKQFINFEHNPYDESSIPDNLINFIMEDSEGYLWIATYNHALSRSTQPVSNKLSDLRFNRFNDWYHSFPDKNILSIYEDKYRNIWLGYEGGVVVYNKERDSFTELIFESDGIEMQIADVRGIGSLSDEQILLTGSSIIVLQNPWRNLNGNRKASIPVYNSRSFHDSYRITALNIENPGSFWIGSQNNGLSRYALKGDSLYMIDHYEYVEDNHTSISSNAVFCIKKDKDQNLWVGTFGGGLNRLIDLPGEDGKGFEKLRDTLGLTDNAFYGIIEENDSILWCGTDMGISRFNSRTFETDSYNMYDGLASNNFRQGAYHKGQSGYYYFGGLNGLTAFKPDQILPNLIPPQVRLTDLKINNRTVPVGERHDRRILLDKHISEVSELVLTRDDQTVSVELTAFHTSIPEKNRLSYILEGFDKEWIHINSGTFSPTYTNLTPGNYTFRVRGYNCDGIISEEETTLQITMLAPWFARPLSQFLFAILVISIVFGVSRYVVKLKSLQNKLHFEQLDKERIKETNQSKLRFFTNISHEFKTPLSLISIPLQKLQQIIKNDEEKEYLDMIEKNSNRLIRLIDQLLTFRKIEHGKFELKITQTSMDDLIYPVADAFESLSVKKGILFYHQVKDPAYMIQLDLEKFEQVLFNLLSNAFKYTPPQGKVRLEGSICQLDEKKYACFEVSDTGVGIKGEELDKIFERFYQSGPELTNTGTGIGLSYSRSIVELHKGFINVESTPGKGTRFSVHIPLNELKPADEKKREIKRLNADELLEYESITDTLIPGKEAVNDQHSTILIVDDEDEFRYTIKNLLHKNYRILEASNGTEALKIASSGEPDLIISDVMMPGLNGYDLCKKVKTDIQLCHIPVILLTALEEMDNHIQGVEYGADSYMSKPFNLKYLEVTVQKMIETREKIRKHFTQSHTIPSEIQISGIDSDFIKTVNKAIQDNLDDSSFGVEELARCANLSTSQLYRKLKLLTGQIPNAYIRNFRLQAAADLLSKNPGISVKSVMYEVGVESASHFSHAFKKKFGYSPSEFT